MTIFWITLVMVFTSGCLARMCNNAITTNGIIQEKPNKIFAFIALSILVLVSGLRSNIGDTYDYKYTFVYSIPNNIIDAFEKFTLYSGDSGFMVFQSFIKDFISADPQVLIFICALITNLSIIIAIFKYSDSFELSLFLYITIGAYFVTMNGVRQYLVSAILFLCVQMITTGKWLPYFLIVLLVSTMHTSALIFIPVYYFVRLKPWSKPVVTVLLASIVILISFKEIGVFLLGSLQDTQYGHYQEYILSEGAGANIIRVLVAAVPLILAYLSRKQIEENNDKFINVLINFSILNLVFYVLAVQNWIFARMCMYFALYGLILLPWLINKVFDENTRPSVYVSCVILYSIYFYFETEAQLQGSVYKSNFIDF